MRRATPFMAILALCLASSCIKPRPIVGVWRSSGENAITFEFTSEGKVILFAVIPLAGTYKLEGGDLTLHLTSVLGQAETSPTKPSTLKLAWQGDDQFTMNPDGGLFGSQAIVFRRLNEEAADEFRAGVREMADTETAKSGDHKGTRNICSRNLEMMAMAARMYASDYEGYLPPAPDWEESLLPYVQTRAIFQCPAAGQGGGYALNLDLAGRRLDEIVDTKKTELFFESDMIGPSAVGVPQPLKPGRHAGKNNVAFADGDVLAR